MSRWSRKSPGIVIVVGRFECQFRPGVAELYSHLVVGEIGDRVGIIKSPKFACGPSSVKTILDTLRLHLATVPDVGFTRHQHITAKYSTFDHV